jgi:hypothetical protein
MNKYGRRLVLLILSVSVLLLAACGGEPVSTSKSEPPAVVSTIDGSQFKRIVLTEQAAARLDVQTVPVRNEQVKGEQRMVVPYGALIYDVKGDTFVFASPEPLTFIREAITVDFIEGDKVVLTKGPAIGTEVASVAVAELYGIDTGVGK